MAYSALFSMGVAFVSRTEHYRSNCTHEAWKEGDLWPPVQSDSEEEEEAEEEDVEEEEEAEE